MQSLKQYEAHMPDLKQYEAHVAWLTALQSIMAVDLAARQTGQAVQHDTKELTVMMAQLSQFAQQMTVLYAKLPEMKVVPAKDRPSGYMLHVVVGTLGMTNHGGDDFDEYETITHRQLEPLRRVLKEYTEFRILEATREKMLMDVRDRIEVERKRTGVWINSVPRNSFTSAEAEIDRKYQEARDSMRAFIRNIERGVNGEESGSHLKSLEIIPGIAPVVRVDKGKYIHYLMETYKTDTLDRELNDEFAKVVAAMDANEKEIEALLGQGVKETDPRVVALNAKEKQLEARYEEIDSGRALEERLKELGE